MTLRRQTPKPVDWSQEAKEFVAEESSHWAKLYIEATLRRLELHEYLQQSCPAVDGKRSMWNNLSSFRGRKIPWAPRGFLG